MGCCLGEMERGRRSCPLVQGRDERRAQPMGIDRPCCRRTKDLNRRRGYSRERYNKRRQDLKGVYPHAIHWHIGQSARVWAKQEPGMTGWLLVDLTRDSPQPRLERLASREPIVIGPDDSVRSPAAQRRGAPPGARKVRARLGLDGG